MQINTLRETLMSKLTAERLRQLLHYDYEAGTFIRISGRQGVGRTVGYKDTGGYLQICVDGRSHLSHRLAWLYVYGEWPKGEIDHINGSKSDNRICNLRIATRSQNMANSGTRKVSKGVSWHKHSGKWNARIRIDGRDVSLGYYRTVEDAREAYRLAAIKHFGEFARFD